MRCILTLTLVILISMKICHHHHQHHQLLGFWAFYFTNRKNVITPPPNMLTSVLKIATTLQKCCKKGQFLELKTFHLHYSSQTKLFFWLHLTCKSDLFYVYVDYRLIKVSNSLGEPILPLSCNILGPKLEYNVLISRNPLSAGIFIVFGLFG